MTDLEPKDEILYRPLTMRCLYRGQVLAARADGLVDIELDRQDTGMGDTVRLTGVVVAPSARVLRAGQCARA